MEDFLHDKSVVREHYHWKPLIMDPPITHKAQFPISNFHSMIEPVFKDPQKDEVFAAISKSVASDVLHIYLSDSLFEQKRCTKTSQINRNNMTDSLPIFSLDGKQRKIAKSIVISHKRTHSKDSYRKVIKIYPDTFNG